MDHMVRPQSNINSQIRGDREDFDYINWKHIGEMPALDTVALPEMQTNETK